MRNQLTNNCSSLPETTRIEMTALLQEWLTDSIDLMLQARQAHWNVKDHHFNMLHVLFDKVYNDARKCVDLIAERIVQLDDIAQGSLRLAAHNFVPLDIASGKKHVAEQARAIAFYLELMRKALTNSAHRRGTDTLTAVSRGTEMNLWFVEVHEPSEN